MTLPPNYFVEHVLPAVGHAILAFITTADAVQLRSCGTDCRDAVAGHKWHDMGTRICNDVGGWRACFPRATGADIGSRGSPNMWVKDADLVHLAGLRELRMA